VVRHGKMLIFRSHYYRSKAICRARQGRARVVDLPARSFDLAHPGVVPPLLLSSNNYDAFSLDHVKCTCGIFTSGSVTVVSLAVLQVTLPVLSPCHCCFVLTKMNAWMNVQHTQHSVAMTLAWLHTGDVHGTLCGNDTCMVTHWWQCTPACFTVYKHWRLLSVSTERKRGIKDIDTKADGTKYTAGTPCSGQQPRLVSRQCWLQYSITRIALSTRLQATNTAQKMTGTIYAALTSETNSFKIKKEPVTIQ